MKKLVLVSVCVLGLAVAGTASAQYQTKKQNPAKTEATVSKDKKATAATASKPAQKPAANAAKPSAPAATAATTAPAAKPVVKPVANVEKQKATAATAKTKKHVKSKAHAVKAPAASK